MMTGNTGTPFQIRSTLKQLAVVLLLATSSAQASIQSCLCTALQPGGLRVNCSSLNVVDVPSLPPDTTELHLQGNQLTVVPPGLFDRLPGLMRVSLAGNPFHCDCGIQYLRNWLLRNRDVVSQEPACASPSSVAHARIADLSDAHFDSCARQMCSGGAYAVLIGTMLFGLIVLLMWGLRLAKNSTFTLDIDERHAGFQADSLRSLKPKHRKRLQSDLSEITETWSDDDLERPLINMELLPQILDVLHKEHNIKIKST